MTNLIEELWYGRLKPCASCKRDAEQVEELERYIQRHKNMLSESMTEEQRLIFEKFETCCSELADINERAIFKHGLKLGAGLVIEVMNDVY